MWDDAPSNRVVRVGNSSLQSKSDFLLKTRLDRELRLKNKKIENSARFLQKFFRGHRVRISVSERVRETVQAEVVSLLDYPQKVVEFPKLTRLISFSQKMLHNKENVELIMRIGSLNVSNFNFETKNRIIEMTLSEQPFCLDFISRLE